MPDKRNLESNQRCKRCGLSAADVPYPENFWIKEGLCNRKNIRLFLIIEVIYRNI